MNMLSVLKTSAMKVFKKNWALLAVIFFVSATVFLFAHRDRKLLSSCLKLDSVQERLCFQEFENMFVQLTERRGPEAAIAKLEAISEPGKYGQFLCHPILHRIGEAAWHSGKDFGALFNIANGNFCDGGYYHGIMIQAFKERVDTYSLCQKTQFRSELMRLYCYHGLGHAALVSFQRDLPKALQFCAALPQRSLSWCLDGVFMEYFIPFHGKPVNLGSDSVGVCSKMDEVQASYCYSYAAVHLVGSLGVRGAMTQCQNLKSYYSAFCVTGVSSQAAAKVFRSDHFRYEDVVPICDAAPASLRPECWSGVSNTLVQQGANATLVGDFCSRLSSNERQACFQQAAAGWAVYNPGFQSELCRQYQLTEIDACKGFFQK